MISRLVLNLRSPYTQSDSDTESGSTGASLIRMRRRVNPEQSFLTRTIGNLDGNVIVSGYPARERTRVAGDPEDEVEVGVPFSRRNENTEVP